MAISQPDYERMRSDKNLTVLLAPSGTATGVQVTAAPTEAELEVGGAAGFQNASRSISWNDYDFAVSESERTNDPSLADDSTYEDFGQINYGGGMSFYMPAEYDDDSNNHSVIYDMTDQPWTPMDVVTRLDGEKQNSTAVVDGDFVSVYRTITDSDTDSDTGADAIRRTVGFLSQGNVAIYTIVGDHAITALPPTTAPWAAGKKARLRATVQDRDYTNALNFRSSDASVVRVFAGGFYEVTGTAGDTATITITDPGTNTTQTVAVTVA